MGNIAIQVEGLGKQYRIGSAQNGYRTFREALTDAFAAPFQRTWNLLRGQAYGATGLSEIIWALEDVSFEVEHGEVVGIIGHNGAGKSTLLKVLSRITEPSKGKVDIYGRVGALLEVGTGFHPELTGRENIYLNGAILGMSRVEIEQKIDQIVDFAGIEKFLETPVKYYSSGMTLRLGFAIAAHLEPDILLVDEVLAVGDAAFQRKCIRKMNPVAGEGRTVLFVSHNLGAVGQLCSRTIWLNGGCVHGIGPTETLIQQYLSAAHDNVAEVEFEVKPDLRGQILSARLLDAQGETTSNFSIDERPILEITYALNEQVAGCHVACIVTNSNGYHLFSTTDADTQPELFEAREKGVYTTQVQLPTQNLNIGTFHITISIGIPRAKAFDRQEAMSFTLHDTGSFSSTKEGGHRKGLLVYQVPWTYTRTPDQL